MRAPAAALALAASALSAAAEPVEVDVELALMVDVSRSMAMWELELQRRGYAEALVSDAVLSAIAGGFTGRIALTYVEWAGRTSHRVIVPWTVVDGAVSAEAVAGRLTAHFDAGMRRTSISGALDFARESIAENGFEGLRKVIDVSGDGPNNDGVPVTASRSRAVEDGLVVNGLPLMTHDDNGSRWGSIPDLDDYYTNCVIGGPGAFVLPVTDWSDFPLAVRRKLVLELAGPDPTPTAGPADAGYDCLIGEKLRRQRELIYGDP